MKAKSLFKKRMVSGIAILLIPVLLSIAVYVLLYTFLNNSISKSEKITFDSVTAAIEQDLNRTFKNLHWMALQENFRTIAAADPAETDPVDNKAFNYMVNNLVNIKSDSEFVDKVCVLFDDFVITNLSYRPIDRFFIDDFFSYQVGEETIKNAFSAKPAFLFEFYPEKAASACYISINYGYTKADILLYIDNARLKSYIKNITPYESGGMFIEDKQGAVIFAGDTVTADSFQTSGKGAAEYLGKKSYQSMASRDTGLSYYFYIPSSNYGGIYPAMQAILIVSIVLTVVIAVLLLILSERKSIKPILQLKDKIAKYNDGQELSADELESIDKNLDKLIEKNQSYESRLEKNRYVMANNIFIRLLRNLPMGDSLENICEEYGLKLFGKKITVLALDSPNIREGLESLNPHTAAEMKASISQDRKNLAAETFTEFDKVYVVDGEEYSYLILLSDPDRDDEGIVESIKRCARKYQAKANEEFKVYVSFAISNTVKTPEELHRAYKQAENARSFGLLLGSDNEIIVYSQIRPPKPAASTNLSGYKALREQIREKNFEEANIQLGKLLDVDFSSLNPDETRCKMYSLVEKLIEELSDATMYYEEQFIRNIDYRSKLLGVSSLEALRNTASEIFKSLADYSNENVNYNAEWVEGVKSYISQNFSDINLNVAFLADKFNYNLSYFSRAFKKETGRGVFEYIEEKRIKHAKELLKKNKPVGDVAVAVGYLDSRTFIRAFKKCEGDTPSKYKRK